MHALNNHCPNRAVPCFVLWLIDIKQEPTILSHDQLSASIGPITQLALAILQVCVVFLA